MRLALTKHFKEEWHKWVGNGMTESKLKHALSGRLSSQLRKGSRINRDGYLEIYFNRWIKVVLAPGNRGGWVAITVVTPEKKRERNKRG